MPVPTVDWWRKKTTKFGESRKNSLITDIDILLGEFHAQSKTDLQRQKILILLLYYVTTHLISKGDNTSWKRKYVVELRDEVVTELRKQPMQDATQARLARGAGQGSTLMKADAVELLQPRDLKDKLHLRADLNVRRVYEPSHVVDTFLKDATLGGYANDLKTQIAQGQGAPDYVDSLQILAASSAGGGHIQRNLEYLSKAERTAWKLKQDELNRLCLEKKPEDGDGDKSVLVPYDKPGVGTLYAMDTSELIYVHPYAKTGLFHHSSFLSGRPVICAGMMILEQGRIKHVDNSSGHYKPTTSALLECVRVLEDHYDVDVRQIKVQDVSRKPQVNWKSGAEFLQKNGVSG